MSSTQPADPAGGSSTVNRGYQHEAFLYAGRQEFLQGTLAFIQEAVVAEEPVLVVVESDKIDSLRSELNGTSGGVFFADMAAV
jgi:hypothetical protein